MLHAWFRCKDNDPPHIKGMPKAVIRNRISRQYGPYLLTVASSCGLRSIHAKGKATHDNPGGFVSVRLYRMPDTDTPVLARKWQAESWLDAKDELAPLMRHLRSLGPVVVDGLSQVIPIPQLLPAPVEVDMFPIPCF